MSKYAVRFDFPDDASPTYAGLYKGAWGWAPTLATAELFDSPDEAATLAANGYGEYSRRFARVIAVDVGEYPVEKLMGAAMGGWASSGGTDPGEPSAASQKGSTMSPKKSGAGT